MEFGGRRRKDRGRSEGRCVVVAGGGGRGSHTSCHVMVVAARGESLSDPRKERVRFHPEPRFWGTYWLWPPVGGAPNKEPFSSPQLSFYHDAAIGVYWDTDTSMPRPCTALHSQSVSQSSTDLAISALPSPRTTRRLLHGSNGGHPDCRCPSCPSELRNPGFDSPLLACLCWAGRLRNLLVPVCSGLGTCTCPLPARPPTS